jgi:hypothetical protein
MRMKTQGVVYLPVTISQRSGSPAAFEVAARIYDVVDAGVRCPLQHRLAVVVKF